MSQLKLEHCIYSHVDDFSTWVSSGVDDKLLQMVSTKRPRFDPLSATVGDSSLFQMEIDSNNVAVGRIEVAQRHRGPFMHEHIVLLKYEEYAQAQLPPKSLWNNGFINYNKFYMDYSNVKTLPPLKIDVLDHPPQIDILRRLFQSNADLKNTLRSMCLSTITDPLDSVLAFDSIEQTTEFLFSILSVLPVDLRPYVSFLAGMQPKQNREKFNFWLMVGRRGNSGATTLNADMNYEVCSDLSKAVFDDKIDRIKNLQEEFHHLRNAVGLVAEGPTGRLLNTITLGCKSMDALMENYVDKIKNLITGGDFDKALEQLEIAPKLDGHGTDFDDKVKKLKNEIYKKQSDRVLHLYDAGDLTGALALVQKMRKYWGEKEDLKELDRKVVFVNYIRTDNNDGVLTGWSIDMVLDHINEVLRSGKLSSKELNRFFSSHNNELERLRCSTDNRDLVKLEIYRKHADVSALTAERVRQNPDLVKKFVVFVAQHLEPLVMKEKKEIQTRDEELGKTDSSTQKEAGGTVEGSKIDFHRLGLILHLVKAIQKIMSFDSSKEMGRLLNPRDESESLFNIFPNVILELRPIVDDEPFLELVTLYLNQIIEGMVKEAVKSKIPLFKQKEFDFAFSGAYRTYLEWVYFKVLRPKIQKMQKEVRSPGSSYKEAAQKLEVIEDRLAPDSGTMRLRGQPSTLDKKEPQPQYDGSGAQHSSRDEAFKDDKQFWEELRKNQFMIAQKLGVIPKGEESRYIRQILEIIKRMQFDPRGEMEILVNSGNPHISLMTILPYALSADLAPPKLTTHEFTDITVRYINQLIKGMFVQSTYYEKTTSNLSREDFGFLPAALRLTYRNPLDFYIKSLKQQVDSDDWSFQEAYSRLEAIIKKISELAGQPGG